MKKTPILFCACIAMILAACAFDPDGNAPSGDDDDMVSEIDAGLDCDAAPGSDATPAMPDAAPVPPDAAPTPTPTHEIFCSALDGTGGRTYEFRGNLKTGMVDDAPSWAPEYLGYGSDYNGHGWPYTGAPNPATNLGNVAVTNGGATWTVAAWRFTSFNAVQGLTPYIASGGLVKWVAMNKWTIAAGQYCTKSPSGTKLCSCNSLPCTPANAVDAPNCVN